MEQYRLVTSEKVLLTQTLHGSVKALCDLLALANPAAFSRGMRAKQYVSEIAGESDVEESVWDVEVAAMLSQVGWMTVPPDVLESISAGKELDAENREMIERLPSVASKLIESIPRMESVREILESYTKDASSEVCWGARVLRAALDYEALESKHRIVADAVEVMQSKGGVYDNDILVLLARGREAALEDQEVIEIPPGSSQGGIGPGGRRQYSCGHDDCGSGPGGLRQHAQASRKFPPQCRDRRTDQRLQIARGSAGKPIPDRFARLLAFFEKI